MPAALVLENVSKRYSGHTAVRDLTLSIPEGRIWGILGPNGAGKSTTLRMTLGIIARDSGTILLGGADPERDRSILARVGYLPEERGLYRKMKVLPVIEFFGALKGVPRREARRRGAFWLERMGLGEWSGAKVETLSKGMQQKVQFITTVLHEPDILILDEPFSGLDPVNQEVLRETVMEARDQGRSVILSTHNMEQAQELCEGICIIAAGEKVLDGELTRVRREHRGNRYRLEFDAVDVAAERFVRDPAYFGAASERRGGWDVELAPGVAIPDLLRAVAGLGVPLRKFEHVEPSLHEIFVHHAGGGASRQARTVEVAHA